MPADTPLQNMQDPPRKGTLEYKLEEIFAGISIGIMTTGDDYCASIMAQNARPLAKAWGNLAKENDTVKRILERITTGGAWGGVVFATASTVIPIAAHHDLIPDSFPMPMSFGVNVPDTPPANGEVKANTEGTVDASEGNSNSNPTPEKPFSFEDNPDASRTDDT